MKIKYVRKAGTNNEPNFWGTGVFGRAAKRDEFVVGATIYLGSCSVKILLILKFRLNYIFTSLDHEPGHEERKKQQKVGKFNT